LINIQVPIVLFIQHNTVFNFSVVKLFVFKDLINTHKENLMVCFFMDSYVK